MIIFFIYESSKPKCIETSWAIWIQGHFLSTNVLDKTKYPGPFGAAHMSCRAVDQSLAEGPTWPTVEQNRVYECGPGALSMLLHLGGRGEAEMVLDSGIG